MRVDAIVEVFAVLRATCVNSKFSSSHIKKGKSKKEKIKDIFCLTQCLKIFTISMCNLIIKIMNACDELKGPLWTRYLDIL